ncbi:MAG: DUF1592 domain-containing protein [Lentisphaeraceae bacterium]|nr:DUF1592 domain-containing protein [Lentisphaeraceae bacterium]
MTERFKKISRAIAIAGSISLLPVVLLAFDQKSPAESAKTSTNELETVKKAQAVPTGVSKYDFKKDIMPIFDEYCYTCHIKKDKGGVRITDLDPDMVNGPDAQKWYGMLDVLNLGDMPPEEDDQPTDKQKAVLIDWLTTELKHAAQMKKGEVSTIIRRLNKEQYTNTVQELLGINLDFGKQLPDDGLSHEGFKNNGETLGMSSLHIDYYMKIARQALDKAIVSGDAPEIYRFKTTIGTNISKEKGRPGLGYQSVSIDKKDYLLEALNPEGKNFKAKAHIFETAYGFNDFKKTDTLYDTFYLDMRGSNKKRFSIEKRGMVLKSSVPHVERAAQIWQGPAPNLKVIMRDFPKEGDFIVKVEASRAPVIPEKLGPMLGIEKEKALISYDDKSDKVTAPHGAIIIDARKPARHKGLNINKKYIHTKGGKTSAQYEIQVPESGIYQMDAVYAARDSRPLEVIVNKAKQEKVLGGKTGDWNRLKAFPALVLEMKKGKNTVKLERKEGAFPHVRSLVFTKLDDKSKNAVAFINKDKPIQPVEEKEVKEYPWIRAFFGNRLDDGMEYATFDRAQKVTAPYGESQVLTFKGRLEDLPLPVIDLNDKTFLANMAVLGVWNDAFANNSSDSGAPVLIKSIEFEGPYLESWPPKSHKGIFIDSENKNNKEQYTREIVSNFMSKAFRRAPKTAEVERLVSFWKKNFKEHNSYEESIKEILLPILCSPHFLYMAEPAKEKNTQLNDYQLASRLSYFLWNTMPDSELLQLAEKGELKNNLSAQVKRMIQDPKSFEFTRTFTHQWLEMNRLESIAININMYPNYNRFVKEDMAKETYHFFHEVLTKNLSILNFIDSDFVMLNQNLAQFYGIKDVYGSEFRPVAVPRSMNRGGLLSQGSFLTGHSSGEDSHPIKRGVWLIEKLLDNPPPEPPPNVPLPDPEDPTLASLTKKQQLEKHRDKASCRNCHKKIDPWGVAFEQYDAIGKFRTEIKARQGSQPVDSKSTLPNGTEIEGIDGLKDYILKNAKGGLNRGVVKHLLSYALGRSLNFTDDQGIKEIVKKVKDNDYRMHSVIESIVTSELFTQR